MSDKDVTLAICPKGSDKARKVTKIIPYKEGGFGILTPYHKAREGFVTKLPVDYREHKETIHIPRAEIVGFTVSDRVKLSYHPDGFAQFSGEAAGKVISGRDPKTGEPKGVGLITHPLSNPIRSGPSVGVTLWGIDDFEGLGSTEDALVFTEEDWYYRRCTEETATGWLIELWVFPNRFWAGVRKRGDRYLINMNFFGYEATGSVIELGVIPLPDQPVFLAAFASRALIEFEAASGWTLNGPGQYDETGKGYALMAFYPKDEAWADDALGSIDFVKEGSSTTAQ